MQLRARFNNFFALVVRFLVEYNHYRVFVNMLQMYVTHKYAYVQHGFTRSICKFEFTATQTPKYWIKVYVLIKQYHTTNQNLVKVLTVQFDGTVYFSFSTCKDCVIVHSSLFILPDCPGGGAPDDPRGRQRNTVRTAALFPAQGSMAIGFGAP